LPAATGDRLVSELKVGICIVPMDLGYLD